MGDTLPKAADFFFKQKDAIRQEFVNQIEKASKLGTHEIQLLRSDDWFLDEVKKAGWDVQYYHGFYYVKLPGTLPPKPSAVHMFLLVLFLLYIIFFVASALFFK